MYTIHLSQLGIFKTNSKIQFVFKTTKLGGGGGVNILN